jgi:hypothetical protein
MASGPSPPRPPPPPPPRPASLQLSVWLDQGERWHARAQWGRDQVRDFDNPFELARFLTRFGELGQPPRPGGLR